MTASTTRLVDQADRERIRLALDTTLVVEAAAGTGKTTELVARMVNTLAAGHARIGEIVAVTFTEKAAGELKLRLREEIERARGTAAGGARARLEDALAHLEDAHVSTIHGFCADLLRERPVEADVDPRFEVLLEPVANQLLDAVVDQWLRESLEAPREGVRRALRRSFRDEDGEAGPRAALRRAVRSLSEWRDFATRWRRDPLDRRARVTEAMAAIHAFAELSATGSTSDNLYVDTESIRRFARLHGRDVPTGPRGEEVLDELEALLGPFSRDEAFTRCRTGGRGTAYAPGVPRDDVRRAHEALKGLLEDTAAALDADLAALLQQELQPCLARYEAAKQERGALDFTDLLVRARDLLRGQPSVRADFQQRYRRLFVDEFQDTDPIQAEILLLLAADTPDEGDWTRVRPVPGKLFIVGDPKQAIYRFRRADVETYWQVKSQLVAAGAVACQLRTCFRSVPTLQRAINHVFAEVMDGDAHAAQASYVALEPVRSDLATQPALVVLPVPRPYATRNVSGAAIDKSLPDAVGGFVDWLVRDSGWTVSERAPGGRDAQVPIQARHVAILFRRFNSWGQDVTRPYVQALEARQVPHLLVGGRSFHEREEVDALRVALCAIEWPDDELSVYAALRGGFFAFPDHELLAYRDTQGGRLNPLLVGGAVGMDSADAAGDSSGERDASASADESGGLRASVCGEARSSVSGDAHAGVFGDAHSSVSGEARSSVSAGRASSPSACGRARSPSVAAESGDGASETGEIEDALRLLRRLHRQRNRVPVQDTVQALLRATRAHAGLALRPGGEQALANVLHVVELARQYEASEGASFRGFVQQFLDETHTEAAESPILEEGTDGVRLMTVHKAKGLEFPVVILADITCRLATDRPSRALVASRGLCVQVLAGCAPAELVQLRDAEIARDRAEGHRLAYVAATRARDLLVVPGVGDDPYPGPKHGERWIDVLNRAIYPDKPWPAPEPAVGCPEFGRDTVMVRPDDEMIYAAPVRPGRYTLGPAAAPYDVTWWDPYRLHLDARLTFGRRQAQLIDKAAPESRVHEGLQAVDHWTQLHDLRLAHGRVPSLQVQRVTDAAQTNPIAVDAVRVDQVEGRGTRSGGRAFGALAHEVLAAVALDASDAEIAAAAAFKARVLGTAGVDLELVTRTVRSTLQHPLLRQAMQAEARGQCRREAPVTLRLDDGTLVEGQLDLAFEDVDGWTVVDFKTDADLDGSLDAYRRQVALYAQAITTATGRPAGGVILRI